MKLIVTSSIKKTEFEPIKHVFGLDLIKIAAKKCIQGLGKDINSSTKIPFTKLKKVYITSSGGAGRAVFLLKISDEKSVLVIVRRKNNKLIGANMTVENTKFKKLLDKNLDAIINDLKSGDYEEFDIENS